MVYLELATQAIRVDAAYKADRVHEVAFATAIRPYHCGEVGEWPDLVHALVALEILDLERAQAPNAWDFVFIHGLKCLLSQYGDLRTGVAQAHNVKQALRLGKLFMAITLRALASRTSLATLQVANVRVHVDARLHALSASWRGTQHALGIISAVPRKLAHLCLKSVLPPLRELVFVLSTRFR